MDNFFNEKLIFDVLATGRSHSQKGDLSGALREQGFFGTPKGTNEPEGKRERTKHKTLEKRDDLPSGGNPVDTKAEFFKQNPN